MWRLDGLARRGQTEKKACSATDVTGTGRWEGEVLGQRAVVEHCEDYEWQYECLKMTEHNFEFSR